jgi:parallel beta-helix repeat protein/predicted outer membrane repeat protein
MAAKKNGQRLAGTSRKPGSKVSTRLTLAAKIMIFAAVFTGHFLTTSLNQKKMVTFFKKLLLSITICFSFMMANSQVPTLNGAITSNLTAPLYYVTGDIYISSGVSITISAGTTLEFQDGLMFTINGTLTAVGSSGSEITFTASNPGTGWFGIELTSTSSSTFTYCIIEYVIKNQQPCNSNFSSCGGVYQSSATASFTNCTFRDNEVCSGSGVYVVSSLAQIYDCTFHNNVAEEYGGAIYINNASQNSNIQLNTIENNTAEQGGGMYFTSCDYEIVVDQNDLNYNEAEYGAGAYFNEIDISGESPFADNTVYDNTASVDGGGLYFNSCIIQKIEDNTLELNEADDGGGIYVNESKINIMILNLLENNSADNDGGGIFLNESYIRFRLSKLIGNSASNNGGAICISGEYISGDPNFIVNSLLADNDAGSNGGGIYTDEQFISYSNTIADNSATNGGGIYNYLATPTVINTIIWGNTATNYNPQASPTPSGTNGYSYTCCRSITNCATCTTNDPNFVGSGNYALDRASSCYNTGYNSAYHESIDLDGNTRVFHNTIDIGAYEDPFKYICGQLSTETWTDHNPKGIDYKVYCDLVVPAGSTLTVNSGATIAFDDGLKLEVNGSIDVNGTVNDIVTFTALDQNDGWGGIQFVNLNNASPAEDPSYIQYCDISYVNKPATIVLGNPDCPCTDDNSSIPQYSGSIFIYNSDDITISNCLIHDNFVCAQGGGIYVGVNSDPLIYDNEIYDNTASKTGGGICVMYSSDPDIYGNEILDNEATTRYGGGIRIGQNSNPEIYSNEIVYNFSDLNGGGISICNGCDPIIYSNFIENNDCEGVGGGISIHKGNGTACEPILYNNLIDNNNSVSDGGGIYISNSNPKIYNCTIADNEADGDGDGVYFDPSTCEPYFHNTIIYHNNNDDVYEDGCNPNPNPDSNMIYMIIVVLKILEGMMVTNT